MVYDLSGDNTGSTTVKGGHGKFCENIRTLTNFGERRWQQGQSITINNPDFLDPLGGWSREDFLSTVPVNITIPDNDCNQTVSLGDRGSASERQPLAGIDRREAVEPRIAGSPVVRERRVSRPARDPKGRRARRVNPPRAAARLQAASRRSAHQVTTPEVARLSRPPIRMSMGISAAGQFLMLMKTGTM